MSNNERSHQSLHVPETTHLAAMRVVNHCADLSKRQRELLLCFCDDMTIKDAARGLNISAKTVEFHRQAIKTKLGVSGTAGMVRYAIRRGLLEP